MTAPAHEYPPRLPRPAAEIPAGQILVHNHVRPARRQGTRGFRFWYQPLSDRAGPCPCGWAPELGTHYRIKPELREPAGPPPAHEGPDHAST